MLERRVFHLPDAFFNHPFTDLSVKAAGEIGAFALAIYLTLVAMGRLLKRRIGARLGRLYQIFCAVAAPYLAICGLYPTLPGRRELGTFAAVLGTGVLLRVVDQYFWRGYFEERRKAPVPKFIREVVAVLTSVAVVLLLLEFGYGVRVPGLLAASGIIGIVLGFALQDSLGNIIAGFAIQFGRPFQVGDWLLIDGQAMQAVEINWRSTRFVTNDDVQYDVPNQHLVRQTIVNYHGGGSLHAMRIDIGIDYETPPNRVKDILAQAASASQGVEPHPAPSIFLKQFGDSAVIYEIRFWLKDHRLYNAVADDIRTNVWYALRRQRIQIPLPNRTVHLERTPLRSRPGAAAEDRHKATLNVLLSQPLFSGLGEEHVRTLMERCPVQHYGRGEIIIREGANGTSMFVLLNGEASVTIGPVGQSARVATLRDGDCFGEMSLLTGERRSASILAAHDCEVLEVTKPIFGEIVISDPTMLTRLSELLARRQMETEGIVAARAQPSTALEEKEEEYRSGFLQRLKSFFEV